MGRADDNKEWTLFITGEFFDRLVHVADGDFTFFTFWKHREEQQDHFIEYEQLLPQQFRLNLGIQS